LEDTVQRCKKTEHVGRGDFDRLVYKLKERAPCE
jgi:hypothetical protein